MHFLRMSLRTSQTLSVASIVVTLPEPAGIRILEIEKRMRSIRISTGVGNQF
jgi:hypothetical protein